MHLLAALLRILWGALTLRGWPAPGAAEPCLAVCELMQYAGPHSQAVRMLFAPSAKGVGAGLPAVDAR